jgi:2-polyprenyl-6-methoxyphenol hydroxylase-like FAD-dependent oxidoreductase
MPDGVAALRHLGVTIPEGDAHPFRGIRFLSDGASAAASFPRGIAYGVRRIHLHQILLDHAAACGVQLLWQTAVTGLHSEGAMVSGELLPARWIVGADGSSSRVRKWAKLDRGALGNAKKKSRFGFRRHYRIPPWTDFMELYWGRRCQIQRTRSRHTHPNSAPCVSRPHRARGRCLGRRRRHHRRRSMPGLSAKHNTRRLPRERRSRPLPESSSRAAPPSRIHGSHDDVPGPPSSREKAHHADLSV